MKRLSVGGRMFFTVLLIFLVFSVAFVLFQYDREKEFGIQILNTRLQDFNRSMAKDMKTRTIGDFLASHSMDSLRVTVIDKSGRVIFDNMEKNVGAMGNHAQRQEVRDAIAYGSGYDLNRLSSTIGRTYFYSATYFPAQGYVIRTALPYDVRLSELLAANHTYLWFSLTMMLALCFVLYRFTSRLGRNITNLRMFAGRANRDENIEIEELARFPDDELGEIAERIIKIYMRLKVTRKEQARLKRELTQNIAHELKTPTSSIRGYLETIIDNPQMDETTSRQFLMRCHAQAERLTSLLQDISTLNRMDDAKGQNFVPEQVDINNMVEQIRKETALEMEKREMKWNVSLPDGIVVAGNPSLLYSVFRNLTDNAILYAGDGTTVSLRAENAGAEWKFEFSDNGVGVPQEHLPRIFERFYRIDKGRSRQVGGTGLGLAIVKNAVLIHRGRISANVAEPHGIAFVFTLPCNSAGEK